MEVDINHSSLSVKLQGGLSPSKTKQDKYFSSENEVRQGNNNLGKG